LAKQTPPEPEVPEQDLHDAIRLHLEQGDLESIRALVRDAPAADVADALEDLDDERQTLVFRLLDAEAGAEVLDELGAEDVQSLAESAPRRLRAAVGEMEPDEVADVLEALDDKQAEALMEGFTPEQASVAEHLLTYPSDTAGGLMTTDFVSLPSDITAREAIELTQASHEAETVGHIFVAGEGGLLVGYLPLARLVFAPPAARVGTLITDVPFAVKPDVDQEELVRAATRYDLEAIPVTDDAGRLIGVVTIDDILEAAEQEADEDIYRLAGTGERDPVHASVSQSTRLRLPWLMLSVLDGLFIAFVLSRFEGTLRVVDLAFFIPLIPLMGGQVAIQSSAIMVRGLALGNLRRSLILRFMGKQFVITLLLAGCCATAAGIIGRFLVGSTPQVMIAVGLAVGTAITFSGSLGMVFPLLFNRIGIDPAVSSGPFITMLNDLFCICIYLALGMAFTAASAAGPT
jgi:magnesium transporter